MSKSKTPNLDAWLSTYNITFVKEFELQIALKNLVEAIKKDLADK